MVELNQKYRVEPVFSHNGLMPAKAMVGTVVYVHPQGRYATLGFKGVHGTTREAFFLDQLTERNRVLAKGRRA